MMIRDPHILIQKQTQRRYKYVDNAYFPFYIRLSFQHLVFKIRL